MPHTGESGEVAAVVRREVRAALSELLECAPEEVDLGRRLTELPGMDSLRLVESVVTLEDDWNISLDDEALFDVRTGDDLCALIERTMQANEEKP
ncbi:acyl carrier protein [Streptomyces formicae]|uniref:Acyl carrier protein n=1 Tax=Streptomyces formicae TaxID=1616117 RepID=A0ABY3WJA3_9ACTN|nr:acyl carrier protein [Streptomyces formicae]UNM11775.1 acyl carrier protein [Streptomyces formicae]